jgi:DNA-cytosine methyltransferase
MNDLKKLRVISLFSGYGTQELALKYIGVNYENIAYCDNLKIAGIAYDSIHETKLGNLGDIRKIDTNHFPECDLLTYSFPCQDISISGVQKGIKEGTRSGLLYEVERILLDNKPKYLLMENVKNLLSKKHKKNLLEHIDFLNSIGYGCFYLLLNGADYGCPQNRERVFMMSVFGETNDYVKETMLRVLNIKKSRVMMRDFIEDNVDESLYLNCEFTPHTPKTNSICKLSARRNDLKYDQARRIYSIDGCSPCLTTTNVPQIMLDNSRVRILTAREGYRFMGVHDEDIDLLVNTPLTLKNHHFLAGNSICVPVMESIFTEFFSDYIHN